MKKFKQGDYCLFNNEEIPTIIELLRVNGYPIWETTNFDKLELIICDCQGDFFGSYVNALNEDCNEISRHDFMIAALRLYEGDGMRSDMSTPEQIKHIFSVLNKLGLMNLSYGDGLSINTKSPYLIKRHIPYSEWCKRLNEDPIDNKRKAEKENDRYQMCQDQPAQIDCRNDNCNFYQKGSCVNISPAITLNSNNTFVCWSFEPISKTPVQMAMDAVADGVVAPKCVRDGSLIPDSGKNTEKAIDIFKKHWIKSTGNPINGAALDHLKFAIDAIEDALDLTKNTLTIPDGTTVDLTKPLEISQQGKIWHHIKHYVGVSSEEKMICETDDGAFIGVNYIRNKPETDFKHGTPVWFAHKGLVSSPWFFGTIQEMKDVEIGVNHQNYETFKNVTIRSAFDKDGNPVYPPFNDLL